MIINNSTVDFTINRDGFKIKNYSDKFNNSKLIFEWLGKVSFNSAWRYQQELHQNRVENKINDTVLLLEHDHVYTFGKNADTNHLLPTYSRDADVVQIDRGGDITYHGPGQLVVYPIIDLHNYKMSVSWYVRSLEKIIIHTLSDFNIKSERREGLTGVWVEDEKIAAIGVRLSKWVTMHGFAINLNPDMSFFDGMIPCGIFEYGVTSVAKQIANIPKMIEFKDCVIFHINKAFQ